MIILIFFLVSCYRVDYSVEAKRLGNELTKGDYSSFVYVGDSTKKAIDGIGASSISIDLWDGKGIDHTDGKENFVIELKSIKRSVKIRVRVDVAGKYHILGFWSS